MIRGVIERLVRLSCLFIRKVSFATGASAGGLVAGLFAAGLSPTDMGETVVKFRRSDFWDPVGFGGLLRGKKFEVIVETMSE